MLREELRKGKRVKYNGKNRSWLVRHPKALITEVSTFNNSALVTFYDKNDVAVDSEWIGGSALSPAGEHEELLASLREKRDKLANELKNLDAAIEAVSAL